MPPNIRFLSSGWSRPPGLRVRIVPIRHGVSTCEKITDTPSNAGVDVLDYSHN